jgi:hypothetical protein
MLANRSLANYTLRANWTVAVSELDPSALFDDEEVVAERRLEDDDPDSFLAAAGDVAGALSAICESVDPGRENLHKAFAQGAYDPVLKVPHRPGVKLAVAPA